MNIKVITKIIDKGIGLALIGSINSFVVSPVLSQSTGCSNYWVNPNTGKTECFGSSPAGSFEVVPEDSDATTHYDPFQTAKQSLDESCFSIWLENNRNLDYGSRKYKRLERSYEDCKVAQKMLKEEQQARQEQERVRQSQELKQRQLQEKTFWANEQVRREQEYARKEQKLKRRNLSGHIVTGTVRIYDYHYGFEGQPCNKYRTQYKDIKHGSTLTVKNGRGEVIKTTRTPAGFNADSRINMDSTEQWVYCVVPLEPFQVPDSDFYVFSIGNRGELAYSRADMKRNNWKLELKIGE